MRLDDGPQVATAPAAVTAGTACFCQVARRAGTVGHEFSDDVAGGAGAQADEHPLRPILTVDAATKLSLTFGSEV